MAVQDYPEHRLQFFSLLRAITNACFVTLFAMSPAQLRLVIDSIVWAFRHTERNVADTGLCLLLELLTMFERSDFATQFHQTYYLQLVQEIFAVMTGAPPLPSHCWLCPARLTMMFQAPQRPHDSLFVLYGLQCLFHIVTTYYAMRHCCLHADD